MFQGMKTGKPPGFTEEQHKAGLIPQAYYRTVGETPEGYAARINALGDKSAMDAFKLRMRSEWEAGGSNLPFEEWLKKRFATSAPLMQSSGG